MILFPVLAEQTISKQLTVRDVTPLPISAQISSVASRLLNAGITVEEVEDDILEIFDFLEDCTISNGMITITAITDEPSKFHWKE